jgi:hypothetical protein
MPFSIFGASEPVSLVFRFTRRGSDQHVNAVGRVLATTKQSGIASSE